MPLYDYLCRNCGDILRDRLEKSDLTNPPPCLKCGDLMERLPSSFAAHFKGSGFYQTDYKNAAPAPSNAPKPHKGTDVRF